MPTNSESAAYSPGQCAHPQRCGSDGAECCHDDCWWSPAEQLQREEELLLRTMRVAQMQREQRAVLRRRIFDDYAR